IASESAELVDFGAPWGTCIAGREARQLRACGLEQLLDPTAAPGERGLADIHQLGSHGVESGLSAIEKEELGTRLCRSKALSQSRGSHHQGQRLLEHGAPQPWCALEQRGRVFVVE